MNYFKKYSVIIIAAIISMQMIFLQPAFAITLGEEDEMSREFMRVVLRHYEVIRDPIISDYVNDIGNKILAVVPQQPFKYRFYVIKEDTYNAFSAPAGQIFINSGLIEAMESEDELAGILSHEIAHSVCRHISQKIERSGKIGLATLAGVAAGILMGIGGAGSAAGAVVMGSAAAGQSVSLAYSREDEAQADQLGMKFLTDAGYNADGLIVILKKIRARQWFDSKDIPTYLLTHPAVENRIAYIDSWIQTHPKPKNIPAYDPYNFRRTTTWLLATYGNENKAKKTFEAQIIENPNEPLLQYGYALMLEREGKRKDAVSYLKKALEKRTFDPYLLKELGKIYFLNGQYAEALKTLEGTIGSDDPEAQFYLARCYLEANRLDEAISMLEQLTDIKQEYADAYYFLGEAYGKADKQGDSHYCLGIYYKLKGDIKTALFHFNRAAKLSDSPFRKQRTEDMLKDLKKDKDKEDKEKEEREKEEREKERKKSGSGTRS